MMKQYDYRTTIILSDSREIVLGTVENAATNNMNKLESVHIVRTTTSPNQNPVGVISSDTCSIIVKSFDRSLSPLNASSTYAGFMDHTAYVKIEYKMKTVSPAPIASWMPLGRFYVNTWDDTSEGGRIFSIQIECTDWIGATTDIKLSVTPTGMIYGRCSTGVYLAQLLSMISSWNNKYALQGIKLDYSEDFAPFNTINFYALDRSNMQTILNYLTQGTVTNFYISKDNVPIVDSLEREQSDLTNVVIDDGTNTIVAAVTNNNLFNYDDINVTFNTYILSKKDFRPLDEELITSASGLITIPPESENGQLSLQLENNVIAVTSVRLVTDYENLEVGRYVVPYVINGYILTVTLPAAMLDNQSVTVEVFGRRMKIGEQSLIPNRTEIGKKVLDVSNLLISGTSLTAIQNLAGQYRTIMLGVQKRTAEVITVQGYYDLEIEMGDIVTVNLDRSLKISGTFKVIGIDITLSTTTQHALRLQRIILNGGV